MAGISPSVLALSATVLFAGFTGALWAAADTGSSAGASAPMCTAAQLKTTYWTSEPEMAVTLSGVTFQNTGRTCLMPTELNYAAVVNSKDEVVHFTGFRVPTELAITSGASTLLATPAHSRPEFANTVIHRNIVAVFADRFTVRQLTLPTGGRAVLVIVTAFSPNYTPTNCVSPPKGGGFLMRLSENENIMVPVPLMPAPAGGPENVNGSAFYECSTGAVSPFITWNEAAKVVGPPPSLASRDSPILDRAP